jgi:Domain of unknown function (DUF5916)
MGSAVSRFPIRTRNRQALARVRSALALGLTAATFLTPAIAQAQTPIANANAAAQDPGIPDQPKIHAHLASSPIIIDGKLDEPAWQDAEPIFLTQQSPSPGKPTPYKTEVRVLIYRDALIFGFRCTDPDPSKIQVHTLARDGNQGGDDTISVVLDSFGDKRTGYYFQINEAAARLDGLVSGPGTPPLDWDGIWNARTARTPDGWSAEIWIPAQTLNFRRGDLRWGLQLDRTIVRDQTTLRWSSPTLDSDLWDMSRAGDLEIMAPLKQGKGLEFGPYLNGKMLNDFPAENRNWLAETGGEVTWRITPQLAIVGTVNTDFAETEVDSRQINVTPYPLYFPEKRAFFLEGANQYTFGLNLEMPPNLDLPFLPFFSRNVGLLDGYNIPINGGVKLNGHVGPWSLALLDVQTRTTYVPGSVVQDLALPSAKVNGTNLLASRVSYDVDQHLRIGANVTNGDPEAQLTNTFAGMDAVWRTSTFMGKHSLDFGGWGATTQGQLPKGSREAWGVRAEYPNDLVNCYADTNRYGDGFDPLLGYLPRPATQQTTAGCYYGPRPSPDGSFRYIRQAFFKTDFSRITDTQGNLQSQNIDLTPIYLESNAGDYLAVSAFLRHETLTTPFSVVPSVTYPVGSFDFERYGAKLQTSSQRTLQFTTSTFFGGYYNGRLLYQADSLTWAPFRGKVVTTFATVNDFGKTPQGNYVERLYQFNGALALNPDLSLSSFVQYDNVSYALSSNTRLRWTIKPGDDFFLIWNRTWIRNIAQPGTSLDPDAESLTAKIRWTFRL